MFHFNCHWQPWLLVSLALLWPVMPLLQRGPSSFRLHPGLSSTGFTIDFQGYGYNCSLRSFGSTDILHLPCSTIILISIGSISVCIFSGSTLALWFSSINVVFQPSSSILLSSLCDSVLVYCLPGSTMGPHLFGSIKVSNSC